MEKKRMLILIIAAVGIIGSFMPWASVFGGMANIAGTEWGGWLTIILFATGGVLAYAKGDRAQPIEKNLLQLVWLSAAVALVFGLVKLFSIPNGADAAFGLWLVVLAAGSQIIVVRYFKSAAGWDLPDKVADVVRSTGNKLEETPKAEPEKKDEPEV